MKEEFEVAKDGYCRTTKLKNIWENPITKFIISNIPFVSASVNSYIQNKIAVHQKKKIERLFEIILEDDSITMDDVQDVECIMEIVKTIDVINRLIKNDKVEYFAKLLKNSIKDEDRNIDEFEELLYKLETLSLREIELLNLLYDEEEKLCMSNDDKLKEFNVKKSWKAFVEIAKSKYLLNESEISSIMLGIMRTGFCICEWRANVSDTGLAVYIAPEYRKLILKIQ